MVCIYVCRSIESEFWLAEAGLGISFACLLVSGISC